MMSLRRIQITLVILLVLAGLLLINTPLARSQQTSLEVPQGDARVAVPPTGGIAQLGTLPLYLTRSETAHSTTTITAWTQTLALSLAGDLSPAQFAFELAATTPDATTSSAVNLQLIVDYSRIPLPYGGSFADRLTLYRVHNCAMQISVNSQQSAQVRAERPSRVLSCTDWEPLTVTNDRAGERLLADLALPLFTVDNTKDMSPADLLAEAADAAGGPSYYVLSSLAAGSQGDYSYTPLASVRDYQVDLHTGALTTGYTIPVPPPRGGAAPNVNLNYNSGAIDGMHTSRNNQPGSVGIGWSLQSGAIVRHLKTCNSPQAPGDLCLTGDNYSIVLNGVSSRLVKESGNRYRLQNDPHWLVELFTNGATGHPDAQKEYWVVTTPDGIRYRFGGEFVTESGADQNSVFYATVYDVNAASCGNFLYDLCDKAWQWNLDRVEDTNGNVTNYFYDIGTNYYKARNDSREAFRKLYVRAGQLIRIEYTTAAGQMEQPHARVLFNLELRCTNPTAGGTCTWPTDFPDTPGDLQCDAYPASCSQNKPTFWSQRRVGSIQTQIYDNVAGRWEMVGHYNLDQGFPVPPVDGQGDTSERKLWLGGISQHPGGDFSHWAFIQLEAEDFNAQSGIDTEPAKDVGQTRNVGWADDGDYILFQQVNFDNGATDLAARVASIYSGRSIEFRLDSTTGPLVATVNVPNTGGWQTWTTVSTTVSGATGIHDLYLVFKNSGMNINWFRFSPHFGSGSPLPGLPPVSYAYEMLPNRRNYDPAGVSPMYMPRIDQITTELGGVVDVTYGQSHPCPSSPASTIRMPYDCFAAWDIGDPNLTWDDGWVLWHKWKVTQQQLSDTFSGNPAATTTYGYSTPTWHYNDDPALPEANACGTGGLPYPCNTKHWNDFRGSEVVTVTDAGGAKMEHRFHRGMDGDRLNISGGTFAAVITLSDSSTRTDSNWLRGQLVEQRRLDAALNALLRTVNWFTTVSTAGSGNSGAYFTAVEKTEETLYGTASKTTRTEYQYDAYGNLVREIHLGDLATTEDDRNLARNYNQNPAIHLVDRVRWEKLWAGTGDGNPGEEVAYTVFGYDHTDPFTGTPTQGNLTEQRAYWATNPAYEYALTTFAYNSRGVVSTVTNPNNQTTTSQFHSFYGYANQETNPLTHVVTTEMNPGWGVVTKVTDANGKVTEIAYDAYGRLVKVWLPGQPTSGPASLEYIYNPAARPAHVQGRQLFEAGTGSYLDNWTYVDGFGREIQSQRPAETSGQRVLASSQYDNLGRLALRSEAYEVSGTAGSGYLPPTWSNLASYHHFSYDELGNQILDELLTGGVTLWSVSDAFDVWQQVHLDANGRQTDYHYDAFGQLRQVVEYNDEGGGPVQYTTSYDYNRRGDLVKVTDHAGNMTTMSYDLLSRKTGMVDPDMGAWQYQYDPAGHLVAQQDGRGWWLHFTYDALGRLTARRRDSIAGPLVATYSYDAGYKGFLDYSRAYDDSGTVVEVEVQAVARDDRYQVTEKRWLVHNAGTFRMAYGYNAGGQMTSVQYPADNNDGLGEVVQRSYDAVGQLESAISLQDGTRFLDQVTYLATGQVAQLRLDQGTNGATLDFTYQAGSLRLDEKKASSGGGSAFDLQHLTFAYDNGGNITTILDARNGGQKQCFGYDWLDRLTSAFTGNTDCSAYSGTGAGPYDHDYAYDPIGNITSFDGAGYTYGSQPHAVTAAHGNAYGYDAAGNQTSRTIGGIDYTLAYDYESRLTAVKEGSAVLATFVYDADGARVLKSDAGGLTVYLDGLYEYALPVAETVIGEVGLINDTLTHADMTVVLGRSYNNPVIFAQPISRDESEVAVVRITDVQADRFTLHVDEAPNHNGTHTTEAVSYIVLEAGSWQLPDGTLLEVGTVQTAATVGTALSGQWAGVQFAQNFAAAPVVVSQVQTDNDPHWVKTRQQLATTTGVNIAMEEEEGKTTPHGTETVGWLAIEPGTGNWSGHLFEAATTPDAVKQGWYSISFGQSFSAAPRFLAALASYDSAESAHLRYRRTYLTATGTQIRVEEDTAFDSEQIHTTETVAYLAIEGDGELTAQGGSSPASSTYYETQGGAMAMRRVGYPADNGIFYILSDHLGSTSLILAQDGTVVKQDYYYPYGGNRGTPYSEVTTRRFTGQYHEAGLPGGEGLSFYNARWYDPQLGRFISADTVVPEPNNPQALNRFSYVLNRPLTLIDPSGHWYFDPGCDCLVATKEPRNEYPTNLRRTYIPGRAGRNLIYGWGAQYYDHIDRGILKVPQGRTPAQYVAKLVMEDYVNQTRKNSRGWFWSGPAQFILAAGEVSDAIYRATAYNSPADAGFAVVYRRQAQNISPDGGCSFSEDTLVMTAAGLVPISTINLGEEVLSYNMSTGEIDYYP